ncbi:protein chiffon [Eupeodes corollae]|uniref:protein chiffon n=1 Tax=Eupeodes corollae TaxID=290404 RepID=UPI002493B9F9|nr:protein chiffon [Eupeodes corollae]
MQPHSEVPTTTKKASATATNSVSPKTTTTATTSKDNKINNQSPSLCKLVKGRRPLVNFNFYLDIKDHQISKKVEERIIELGGNLEFFLTKSVTHFITDRSLPAAPSGSQTATGHGQGQSNSNSSHNNNGHCLNSPSTGVGVNGGGVGGGGGGGVYPITPSPYLQSPQTPTTPKTPYTNQTYSGDSATDGVGSSHSRIKGASTTNNTPNNKKKISRADAMLHRALQSQQQSQHYPANQQPEEQKRPNLEHGAYRIWSLEYAIRFLKKVTADVKQYAKKAQQPTKGACEPIQLKGHFIKIEAISGSHRPYYSVFRNIEWPKIQLGGEAGAFRLTPKRESSKSAKDKPSKTNAMTRKSRSSSKHNPNHMRLKAKQAPKQATEKPAAVVDNSSEKQCGVCEICKIEYDTLTIHLKTKDHEFFARNQNNYLALDSLIKSSASVDKFLEDTSKDEAKEESVEPMEIEEESTRPTRKSSRKQSPPPPVQVSQPAPPASALKIKTKLKEVEVVTEKKHSHNNAKKSAAKLNVPLDSPPIRHPLPTSTIYKVVADSKAQTDPVSPKKSSIIVKFRKIRQTELSLLNGEAENFMFPRRPTSSDRATDSDRQTSTDSNRISSSSISSESHLTEEPQVPDRPDSAAAKRRRTADNSHKANATATATATATSVCYQSFPNTPIQPNKTSQATSRDTPDNNRTGSVTTKPLAATTQRKRRCVGSGRKRRATSRNSRNRRHQRWDSEDRMGEEGNSEYDDDEELRKILDSNSIESDDSPRKSPKVKNVHKSPAAFDLTKGRLKEQTYAFERLPVKELWFEVFRRQDACQERMFEYWGSTSYRKLPYEIGAIPVRQLPNCKICTPHQMVEVKQEPVTKPTTKRMGKLKKVKKERQSKSKSNTPEPAAAPSTLKASKNSSKAPPHNKHLNKATFLSCDLMPRKSPREHASTLAILSCLIKQRKDSEIDEKPPASPALPPKEKTPEKRKTPSPVAFTPRNETPEPLQFVSEISENVKRLRRGQRKFDDFIPTTTPLSPKSNKKKPGKPKAGGLEFEVDEKRLKSLDVKQKSALELEQEIDAYLGRISMKSLRLTPTLPVQESSSSSGFVDDFTSDVDLIDLIDCYDGGGRGGGEGGNDNSNDLYRPAINTVYNLFSAHTRRRKTNKANKTGWPTTRRRNAANTRQNHLLQKSERFRFFSDYQTRQRNIRDPEGHLLGPPTTATSMTPPDTDLDDKDDCTRSSVPDGDEMEEEVSVMCKEDILNNSCMSPSEKADNSDIFTVSSDGLDTDLDVSCNQIIKTEEIDVDDECTTSSTLAAPPPPPPPTVVEAPTPAPGPIEKVVKVKTSPSGKNHLTLAMRSIIKREVKVTCKRLRTPFRRFRQKR